MAKMIFGALIGAAVGGALGYFGRCASGQCPLTSDPIVTALIGFALGAIFVGRPK
ncbi:MAG: DUF6132 family protein [Candidatus Omnitrophica bacterium]|nr:DUF6132 family protein [Candidatus Omnitrophota bacterium]MDD4013289.1 DUF6132 family protein [Candidatus Omnitrophota bacterium]